MTGVDPLLDGNSRYAVRLDIADPPGLHAMGRLTGCITVLGFETAPTAREIGVVLAQALAHHVGVRVDASLIDLRPRSVLYG